jgi:hypothetical protein
MIYSHKKISFLFYLSIFVSKTYLTAQVKKFVNGKPSSFTIKNKSLETKNVFEQSVQYLPAPLIVWRLVSNSDEKNKTIGITLEKPQEKSLTCNFSNLEGSENNYEYRQQNTSSQVIPADIKIIKTVTKLNDYTKFFFRIIDAFEKDSQQEFQKSKIIINNKTTVISTNQVIPTPTENLYIRQEFDVTSGKIKDGGIVGETLNLIKSYYSNPPLKPIIKVITFLQINININIIKIEKNTQKYSTFINEYNTRTTRDNLFEMEYSRPNTFFAIENLITLLKNAETFNDDSRKSVEIIINLLSKNFQIMNCIDSKLYDALCETNENGIDLFIDYFQNFQTSLANLKAIIVKGSNVKLNISTYNETHQEEIVGCSLKMANLIYYFNVNKRNYNYSKGKTTIIFNNLTIIQNFFYYGYETLKKKNDGEYEISFNEKLWEKYKDFVKDLYGGIFKDHKNQNDIKSYFLDNIVQEKKKNSELENNIISCLDFVEKDKNQSEFKFSIKNIGMLIVELRKCFDRFRKK